MNQLQSDIDGPAVRDLGSLELALKTMWEKARAAGDMIARLQTEKTELQTTVQELERSLNSVRSELAVKEHDLKKLRAEHARRAPVVGHGDDGGEVRRVLLQAAQQQQDAAASSASAASDSARGRRDGVSAAARASAGTSSSRSPTARSRPASRGMTPSPPASSHARGSPRPKAIWRSKRNCANSSLTNEKKS